MTDWTDKAGLPEHSPLGASGMDRWQNCPGSFALIQALRLPDDEETPEYRERGTCAHTLIELCLKDGSAPWEHIGEKHHDVEIDGDLATGAQVFLDEVRAVRQPDARIFIEYGISSPVHPLFYGRLDFAQVAGKKAWIRDYKNGVGVVVEAENNAQCLYYAYGLIKDFPEVEEVDIGIVQPNAFHEGGAVRTWVIDAEYVRDWAESTLFPAMAAAELDEGQAFAPGKWCRFCPAKLVCPVMRGLYQAAAQYKVDQVTALDDAALSRDYQLLDHVKQVVKKIEEEIYRRLNAGASFEGVAKLVHKKADRVWKPEAPFAFSDIKGAFTVPILRSPAEMEKLGPAEKTLVREYAYTPESGLTVAAWNDKRPAQVVLSSREVFAEAIKQAAE